MSKAAAAAAAAAARPLSRWDHLFAGARKAAVDGGAGDDAEEYADLFQSHVLLKLSDLSREERDMLEVDSHLDYQMRAFETSGSLVDLFTHINYDATEDNVVHCADLDADSQPMIVHQLRRIRLVCPTGWAALVRWIEVDGQEDGDDDADMILANDDDTVERAMQFEQILHDTFTRAELDNASAPAPVPAPAPAAAPAPARFEVKRKLERLTERIASLSPSEAAAELRAILSDVEDSLPDDERMLQAMKKARKSD